MIAVEVTIHSIAVEVTVRNISVEVTVEGVTTLECLPSTVENSSGSYSQEIDGGDTLVLPDNDYDVYVNGNLNSSATGPSIEDTTINIFN